MNINKVYTTKLLNVTAPQAITCEKRYQKLNLSTSMNIIIAFIPRLVTPTPRYFATWLGM